MKKPEIIYCNIIRTDKEADRIAIKQKDIYGIVDALIDTMKSLSMARDKVDNDDLILINEIDSAYLNAYKALTKVGCKK